MQTATENTVNVTEFGLTRKHPSIYAGFDYLTEGENLTIIDQIATKELRKTEIFKKYAIEPYNDWRADVLADYIFNIHHAYIRRNLTAIMAYAWKLNRVHGEDHPELRIIKRLADEFSSELTEHMAKEEGILFPYIKELVKAGKGGPRQRCFQTMHQPVNVMEMEHESMAGLIHEIVHLCNDYALPKDACATYSVFYKMLAEFENDLHIHIHLENDILFPKKLQLEKDHNN